MKNHGSHIWVRVGAEVNMYIYVYSGLHDHDLFLFPEFSPLHPASGCCNAVLNSIEKLVLS